MPAVSPTLSGAINSFFCFLCRIASSRHVHPNAHDTTLLSTIFARVYAFTNESNFISQPFLPSVFISVATAPLPFKLAAASKKEKDKKKENIQPLARRNRSVAKRKTIRSTNRSLTPTRIWTPSKYHSLHHYRYECRIMSSRCLLIYIILCWYASFFQISYSYRIHNYP